MTNLKDQLESLSAQHVQGITIAHPAEQLHELDAEPSDTVVQIGVAQVRRRGRYILSAAAALVLLGGGFLVATNRDDNSTTSVFATDGKTIVGPNGEDLGIWADAIAGESPQGQDDRSLEFQRSLTASLPEINECLVEAMDSEPLTESADNGTPLPRAASRAFAQSEGFGYAASQPELSPYPEDAMTCYFARSIDGLIGLNDTREKVASHVLYQFLSFTALTDGEINVAGHAEVLIAQHPAIAEKAATWAKCMSDQGHEFDSELLARSHFAAKQFESVDFAALKAEEVAVATAAWDCSGGEAGATLRENVRQRVLADFVVVNRTELNVELDIALTGACQAARELTTNDSVSYREGGEARLQSLGCGESVPSPDVLNPSDD